MMKKHFSTFIKITFCIYCLLMLWLLFGQRIGVDVPGSYAECLAVNYNLSPFKTVKQFISICKNSTNPYMVRFSFVNLIGNIVMFVPLGFFLPCLFEKIRTIKRFLLYVTGIILAVEVVQFFTLLGVCDIDDLILNIPGAVIGYFVWKGLNRNT